MKKLPQFLKKYFWDVDFERLNTSKYRFYIIKRILNCGDEKALKWLNKHFNKDEQVETLTSIRELSPRSANFWTLILDVPKTRVKCLQKQYLLRRKQLWPY